MKIYWIYAILFLTAQVFLTACQSFRVDNLRCEYLNEPLGIDRPHPRFSWETTSEASFLQTAYQMEVASRPQLLEQGIADIWDSGKNRGVSHLAEYKGEKLKSFATYYWKVTVWNKWGKSVSEISRFETGPMDQKKWQARWITDQNDKEFRPAPLFRKETTLAKEIQEARLFITAAGYYRFFINGGAVGENVMDPGYTHFDKRNLYMVYDVTPLLKQGKNTLSAVLGNGWYNIQTLAVWHFENARWRNRPRMICELRLTYSDGSTGSVVSDSSWKTGTGGLLFDNLYAGETFDARQEPAGWKENGFDDSGWNSSVIVEAPAPLLEFQSMPPIRPVQEISPVSVRKLSDHIRLYDFGVNISGVCRLEVSAQPGTKVTLKYGELLDDTGKLNQSNIDCYFQKENNNAPVQKVTGEEFQTDTYIAGSMSKESYMPAFTYHGFRYVQVETSEIIPDGKIFLTALFVHTALERTGDFSCSDTLLNKIYEATVRSYLSNAHSIPTDCPQREKNGWTADAHISADLGLLNFDGITFYEKWLQDFRDNQLEDGRISGIIPSAGWGYDGIGPVWDAALFILPHKLYQYYGDATAIGRIYPNCLKYLEFLKSKEQNGLLEYGLGDWVPWLTKTPNGFTSSCYYLYDYRMMTQFAGLLGKDPEPFRIKADEIRNRISERYFNPDSSSFANGSQTALALGLFLEIAPEEQRDKVAARLVSSVRANGHHLDFGVLGSRYVPDMLTRYGYAEDAFRMATQETAPSWGYWIKELGMTTLSETWTLSPDLKDASLNHVFLGDISAWMVRSLAGINVDACEPGFRQIVIDPAFVSGLEWAEAGYRSVNGWIRVKWKREGKVIRLNLEIPANSTASVRCMKDRMLKSGKYEFTIDQN